MKNGGGHFAPELGGHFELESGAHFKLELGGQYHWNLQQLLWQLVLLCWTKRISLNISLPFSPASPLLSKIRASPISLSLIM